MNALISPNELVYSWDKQVLGQRVAEVAANTFPIAPPLFWIPCADDVVPEDCYYDPNTQTIDLIPSPPPPDETYIDGIITETPPTVI